MEITDILYTALATIIVMVILQVSAFFVTRVLYPPEPRIIYRDAPAPVHQPRVQFAEPIIQQHPPPPPPVALTQTAPSIQLPEYEPRKQASDSLRLDPELPAGLQETRPSGT
jgi:hypothetical protein